MARYSNLTLSEAKVILGQPFGIEPRAVEPLAGGAANSSFRVQSDGGDYVVAVLDNHDLASAMSLARTIEHAARNGLPVDRLIPTKAGALLSANERGVPLLVKRFIRGRDLRDPTPKQIRKLGATLATIHRVSPPDFLVVGNRMMPADRWRQVEKGPDAPGLKELMRRAEVAVDTDTWRALPSGFCHGDFFGDNLLETEQGELVVLDWETASIDPFVLDLGIACVAFIEGHPNSMTSIIEVLLQGYQSVRPLRHDEVEMLDSAIAYGLAMLAFHRFVRHNVRHPDSAKSEIYRDLIALAQRLDSAVYHVEVC